MMLLINILFSNMGNVSNFVSTKEELPEIGQLVWLYDSEHNVIVLGTRELTCDGPMWAVADSNKLLVKENGEIEAYIHKAYIHISSTLKFDYWAEVPKVPENLIKT